MNRNDQIEKVILKELHDKKIMDKVRLINERSHRPRSRKIEKTREEIKGLGGDPSAFKGTLSHLTKAKEVLQRMHDEPAVRGAYDSSNDDDNKETLTPNQEAERKESETVKQTVDNGKKSEVAKLQKMTPEEQENKQNIMTSFIKFHASKLQKANPELTPTSIMNKMSAEELTKHLNAIDASHPHLNTHTKSLKSIMGL
jgi:hypothetical protein